MDGSEAEKMLAVVGDIHGSITTLKKLYYTITDKYLIHRFIFLGDMVDRGIYSKEVIEFLMARQGETLMTFLKGNHEDLLINAVENQGRYPNFIWHEKVGLNTVASFMGIKDDEAAKKSHWEIAPYFLPYMEFFNNFKEYHIEKINKHKFLFSHAGPAFFNVLPEKQYNECNEEQRRRHYPFLWHKNTKDYKSKYFDYIIVNGHEAVVNKHSSKKDLINASPAVYYDSNGEVISINIDTGCCYGGKLTAMIIDDDGRYKFELFPWED